VPLTPFFVFSLLERQSRQQRWTDEAQPRHGSSDDAHEEVDQLGAPIADGKVSDHSDHADNREGDPKQYQCGRLRR